MTSWTIIVLIIYLAAHVIGVIAKKSAERKEQERVRAEMQRRRAQESGVATAPHEAQISADPVWGQPGGPANPLPLPPAPVRTGKPIDDLAARRKQQLDQLRLRREGKSQAGTSGSASSAPPTRPGGMPDLADYDHRARQEAERREQEQARARRERQQREAQKREASRSRREHAKRDQLKRDQVKLEQAKRNAQELARDVVSNVASEVEAGKSTPHTAKQVAVRQTRPVGAGASSPLEARLKNPAALRELFVLKEIIDPPLSLRPDSQGR